MQLDIIKIQFKDYPLHLSDGRGLYYFTENILHSDKLKNAIFTSAAKLSGTQVLTEAFFDSFLLSSAFPFFKEHLFFPRPSCTLNFRDSSQIKAAKKAQFLGKSLFENFINGSPDFPPAHIQFLNQNTCISQEDIEIENFIYKQIQDRVNLSSSTSAPHYMEQLRFHPDAGLFFIVQWRDDVTEQHKALFQQGLAILEDEGVGSDRTYGYGQFTIQKNEKNLFHSIELDVPESGDFQLNLGLYRPNPQEQENISVDIKTAYYQLIERGGYIAEPEESQYLSYRKHSAYFFDIGSVFPKRDQRMGEKIDLCPPEFPHPVWREGSSLFLPIQSTHLPNL